MQTLDIGMVSDELTGIVEQIQGTGNPVVIARRGEPLAALVPLEDFQQIDREKARALAGREPAYQEPQALFEETERLAGLGHWKWDEIEDKSTYCSGELARLHGVTVEAFLQRSDSTDADILWVHPEDRDRYSEAAHDLKNQGMGFDIIYRLLRSGGEILHVREVANAARDEAGAVVRSFGFVQDISEAVDREQELKDNATLLRQAAELAELGYWIWDEIEDRCVFCSDTLAEMMGVTVEGYLRDYGTMAGLLSEIHPDDRDRYDRAIADARQNRTSYDIEHRDRRPDGTYRHLRERGEPLLDVNGALLRTIGIVQDISDQKAAEQALKRSRDDLEKEVESRTAELHRTNDTLKEEIAQHKLARDALRTSEAQLKSFVKYSPTEISIKDKEGRYVIVNPVFEELSGHSAAEVIGRFPHGVYSKDIADQLVAHDRQVLETGAPDIREISGFVSGAGRTYLATKFAISDASDSTIGLGAIAMDITEQKHVEEALKESEERYRELFDESPVAIWEEDWSPVKQMLDELVRGGITDLRGHFDSHRDQLKTAYDSAKILEISRAAIDLYREESREDIIEKSSSAVVVDEELDAFREMVLAFIAGQMTVDLESKDMGGDLAGGRSEIIVRRRVVVPPKHRDDWSRVIYAIEDITERRRLEEQLRQIQKMEIVGQLTGGVAHDFNNLLAVILGNAELLKDEMGPEATALDPILRAAGRGAELTQRLLAFSRQQPLKPQTVDLGGLVSGMSDLVDRTLGETVSIETLTVPDLWPALADPGQVENALLNLALNARDAMPEGGKLTIECANANLDDAYIAENPEAKAGAYAVLAVSDQGIGMTPDVQAHAFEPFFTTKEVGQGSGLGLSMIYGFAKQSGGHVSLYSEDGKGTTVKLYLPRAEEAARRPDVKDEADVPYGAGEAILVIEDDPDVRALTVHLLENLDYRVIDVPHAAAAHEILADNTRVDLVLSDVVLPGGTSGPEFAEQARTRYPNLKIIFMSGYPAEAAKRNGFIGSDSVLLNKPFQRHQLAKALREALG